MTTPAFIVLLAVLLLTVAGLGILAWHSNVNANAPVAVDWGSKCSESADGSLPSNCKHPKGPKPVAVDWGDKVCTALSGKGIAPGSCKPPKPPKKVAVDWGDIMCVPSEEGGCGVVFEVAVDWGNLKMRP
jgi:hypothetical protein